jgi:type I restriction enzyme R subunit
VTGASRPSPLDARRADIASLGAETFDVVIVDECHRSIFGVWRGVLEYFDAHVIGLTATPTKQALGFFQQNLLSEYPYERAVADGVNVDFRVFRIRTEITERGGLLESGLVVPVRDRRTRRERYEQLDEDLPYTAAEVGRDVVAKDQLRKVLATYRVALPTLFPGRRYVPETLIYAKDDHHADEIVEIGPEAKPPCDRGRGQ